MRDYTKIPGYEGMTQPQARYNYLHNLLEAYQGLSKEDLNHFVPCMRRQNPGDCADCELLRRMKWNPAVCCNWQAEADPDRTIETLEELLGRKPVTVKKPKDDGEICDQIAEHYGLLAQVSIAQEECAELIQALSKYRRAYELKHDKPERFLKIAKARQQARDKVSEEMADVYIMLRQIMHLLNNWEDVNRIKDEKLDRQLARIREEERDNAEN